MPGQAEHGLGDDRAADEQREGEAEHGEHRDQGVAQGVVQDHARLRGALGARRADVVLAQHVEHARAREAQDQRGVDDAEHDRRQHQVMEPVGERHARVAVARDRKPAEGDGEDLHQDQAEPEARDARRRASRTPENTWSIARPRQTAETMPHGNADQRRDGDRKERQEERRLGPLPERLRDRTLQEDRLAEIAARQLLQPVGELHRQRLVEPVRGAQLRDVGGGRLLAQHHRRGVAGRQAGDEEHQRGDQQHHHRHAGEARCEVAGHAAGDRSPSLRRSTLRAAHFCRPVFQKNGHGIAT